MPNEEVNPETLVAQALGWVDETTQAITPPIHMSSTYLRDADNQYRSGRVYMRDHNPAFEQTEAVLTALEGGRESLLFASGMAAATAVFQGLQPGSRARTEGHVLESLQLAHHVRHEGGAWMSSSST